MLDMAQKVTRQIISSANAPGAIGPYRYSRNYIIFYHNIPLKISNQQKYSYNIKKFQSSRSCRKYHLPFRISWLGSKNWRFEGGRR